MIGRFLSWTAKRGHWTIPRRQSPSIWPSIWAGQTLAVPVVSVREIIDRRDMTRLPGAPADVLGVVNVRGASVPIVDIDRRLGLPARETGADARTIVFEFQDGPAPFTVGIDADRVRSVLPIAEDAIEPVPSGGVLLWDASMLRGIHREEERLIAVLDPNQVFDTRDACAI